MMMIRSLEIGGAERQLIVLASGLQQLGHEVKVAVFYGGGPFENDLKRMRVPVVNLNRQGRWDLFLFFLRLVFMIKKEQPDILYSYLQVANVWASLVKLIFPRIKVVWSVLASNVDFRKYNLSARLTDILETLLSRIADWIVCNSQAGLVHVLQKGFPKNRMSVVYTGVDTHHFYPDKVLGQELRRRWRVAEGQPLIGMVGRLDPIKDYPNFLRAAALLLEERVPPRFVCVGVGSEILQDQYRRLANSLGLDESLIWAGWQGELLNVYNALDVLVLSSTSEGLPNVVGEAMACGIPCVVTDVGDSSKIVGEYGQVVVPGDSVALKDGIGRMLDRIAVMNNLSFHCRNRIVEEFSALAMVNRTYETFVHVLSSQQR